MKIARLQKSPLVTSVARRWVFATLLVAALPALLHVQWWVAVFVLIVVAWGMAAPRSRTIGRLSHLVTYGFLVALVAGVYFTYDAWFSGGAMLSFFIGVLFLKWLESNTRRDHLLLIFGACILAALGALYWNTIAGATHMLLVVTALTVSLRAIHTGLSEGPWFVSLRQGAILTALALPVMGVLFVTFPRISGPVWDVGLAFGLPVKLMLDRKDNGLGFGMSLKTGQMTRLKQENQTVLVAEFDGVVPYKSELYWRGPVFWDFDGSRWSLPKNWDKRGTLLRRALRGKKAVESSLRRKEKPVTYTVRLLPHGHRWLYALDVPAATAPESFVSGDYQLLSIRKVRQEWRYGMTSYLTYGAGQTLPDEDRQRALAFPETGNARLRHLGRTLRQEFGDDDAVLLEIARRYRSEGFSYQEGVPPPAGADGYDAFYFENRNGGVQVIAGSFVMLARAAGIPARLVAGFRGGSIVALTDFLIVKQSHAHAWAEVWSEDNGWVRVDPLDYVRPVKDLPKEARRLAVQRPSEPKKAPGAATQRAKAAAKEQTVRATNLRGKDDGTRDAEPGRSWISGLSDGITKWTIRYDPARQVELLTGVGVSAIDWLGLLAVGATGLFLLFLLYAGAVWVRRWRRHSDPVARAYAAFDKKMTGLGLPRGAAECPDMYRRRVGRERPDLAEWVEDIVGRYIDIRYGPAPAPGQISAFRKQVKRFAAMA